MFLRHMNPLLRSSNVEGSGGSDEPRNFFSAEYVRELRAENKGLRLKLRGYEDETPKLRAAAEEAEKRVAAATAEALAKAQEGFNARLVASELRAAATKAGIVDLDALRVLDTSGVKVNGKGEVVIPDDLFSVAREAKPYLFKAQTGAETGTTTQTQQAPRPAPTTTKKAGEMSADELAAFERQHGIR